MKIKYLGTAAAEGIPCIFCDCAVCHMAREKGGKNLRTRSQALIDDKILIDLPADTFMHSIQYGIYMHKIKSCVITHSHVDHLYPAELENRKEFFAYYDGEPMTIYAGKSGYEKTLAAIEHHRIKEDRVKAECVEAFRPFMVEGYKFTPLKANHDPNSTPFIYIIEHDGKTMLYGNDSGVYPPESYEYIKNAGIKFDYISVDCTNFKDKNVDGHTGLYGATINRDKLTEIGAIDGHTKKVLNHFSHNHVFEYEVMEEMAEKEGFTVSYDGLEVEF